MILQISPQSERSYLRDRWCVFDLVMLVCHVMSIAEQSLAYGQRYIIGGMDVPPRIYNSWYAVFRSPRPLITIRFLRAVIKFQLPRNRIQTIFKLVFALDRF